MTSGGEAEARRLRKYREVKLCRWPNCKYQAHSPDGFCDWHEEKNRELELRDLGMF